MNAIYKVIWNDAIRQYQVVNELGCSKKHCSEGAVHSEVNSSASSSARIRRGLAAVGTAALLMAGMGHADCAFAGTYTFNGNLYLNSQNVFNVDQFTPDSDGDTAIDKIVVIGDVYLGDEFNVRTLDETVISARPFFDINSMDDYSVSLDVEWDWTQVSTYNKEDKTFTAKNKEETAEYTIGRTRELEDLLGVQVTKIKFIDGQTVIQAALETNQIVGDQALSAQLTGEHGVIFNRPSETSQALLLLNSQVESNYTGQTTVSDSVTIRFGADNSFGQTSKLTLSPSGTLELNGYDQIVKELSGTGTIDFSHTGKGTLDAPKNDISILTLSQSVPGEENQITISNLFVGTEEGSSGAGQFNIELSDDAAGNEVVFNNAAQASSVDSTNKFEGEIHLQNGWMTAYKNDNNNINNILNTSALVLDSGSYFVVDGNGLGKKLVIKDGAADAALRFTNAPVGEGKLELQQFVVESGASVTLDNPWVSAFQSGASAAADIFAANDGVAHVLIDVSESVSVTGELKLEHSGSGMTSVIKGSDGQAVVATGIYNFDPNLEFAADEDGSGGSFTAHYGLVEAQISGGQTLTLGKSSGTGTDAFDAVISESGGSGNLQVDASGWTISLGSNNPSTYTGTTEVTSGTTVLLVGNDAFGQTSNLTVADGAVVELAEGVSQIVHGLSGSGKIDISSGAGLNVEHSGDLTVENVIAGTGDLIIDLESKDNALIFSNSSSSGFSGVFTLNAGSFDLDTGFNRGFVSGNGVYLGSSAVLNFGSSGADLSSLTTESGASVEFDNLIIGATNTPVFSAGTLNFASGTKVTLNGATVEDDLSLIDFDETSATHQFISGESSGSEAQLAVSFSEKFDNTQPNKPSITLEYKQQNNVVADTTWTIDSSIVKNQSGYTIGYVLESIEIRDGQSLVIDKSGTLSANVGGSGSLVFNVGSVPGSIEVAESNSYTGKTTVASGTSVVLSADSGLGSTSALAIASGASVKLEENITQTVKDLTGSGSLELSSGSVFTLDKEAGGG